MNPSDVLSDYLKQQVFVAFDTETTGMWAPINRIVEIGAVKFTLEGRALGDFQSLVNPQRPIPQEVTGIHGITDEMVAAAPTIRGVLEGFSDFCGNDSILVAHNAPFDISFVGHELGRIGMQFGDNPILDTVDICHRFFPGLSSYSLLNLITHFEISTTQAHRALEDAIMVQQLMFKAAPKLAGIISPDGFGRFLTVYRMSQWQADAAVLPDQFEDLQQAVADGIRVEIEYNHPVRSAGTRIIQPQQVFRLGSIYYINAYCELAQGERTFRLDRIISYRILKDSET